MNSNRTDIFKSELLCLKDVADYNFSIPTYQRPYVWGDEQLKKLIDDFYKAFETDENAPYYISSLITKDNGEFGRNSELIDGQQRFTTLWLIALVVSRLTPNHKSEIEQFLKKDKKLRLSFEIRSEVYDYLTYLLEGNQQSKSKIVKDVEEYPYLKNITKAIKSIDGFIKDALNYSTNQDFEPTVQHFGNYIYTKVFFIKNTTPQNTDLNKLFSTINNSGVQLEQTDIVKANLLNVIGDEKVLYSKIWESCENMNNFFERNARFSFPQSNWANIDLSKQFEFKEDTFKYKAENTEVNNGNAGFKINNLSIEDISEYPFGKQEHESELNRDDIDDSNIYCRSIISFGQLLLHTYRLHLKVEKLNDFAGTFHVNRLIEVFKELEQRNDKEEVKRFFKLLWQVRYLFDKYIIKWISDTNNKNETLEIANFSRNEKSYYTRTPYEKPESMMLQSVLYFTGDYLRQYWLSSYLDYLLYNHNLESPTSDKHLSYLEKMDNIFSVIKDVSDKALSWKLMYQTQGFEPDFNFEKYLNQANGTGFKHYWFYKLEYVIWKNWADKDDDKYKNYRITSKNSVEHIYPQNPENEREHPKLENENLDSFGNLVLLSVSQNSEYSNKSVGVKKSMFKEKSDSYDTLKSFHIFNSESWDKVGITEHREKMINMIKKHYNEGSLETAYNNV